MLKQDGTADIMDRTARFPPEAEARIEAASRAFALTHPITPEQATVKQTPYGHYVKRAPTEEFLSGLERRIRDRIAEKK